MVSDPVHFCEDWLRAANAERMGKRVEVDTGQRGGVTTEQAGKMKVLERENRILKEEREILKKATQVFVGQKP